jgi:antitoxin HicB
MGLTLKGKAKQILARPYARVLVPAADGRFSSSLPAFPGCFSQGDSVAEAYANLEIAATNWLVSCLEHGLKIPDPEPRTPHKPRA